MRSLKQYLKVGQIRTAHGVHGAFKIELFSDDAARLAYLKSARFVNPHAENDYRDVELYLQGRKPESLILAALNIESREEIMAYQNWYVEVERKDAKNLAEGEFFVCDLLHCQVIDAKYGEIGEVKDLLQNTSQDVFVIAKAGEADILLPKVKAFIQAIDIENGVIKTAMPDGLYELYRAEK